VTFLLRLMIGTAGLTVALTFAWALAFLSWAHRQPPSIIDHPPATINAQPSTIDARFVASTIDRTAKRYHVPTCSYVKLMQHGREFESEAEAIAAGYEPCQRCIGRPQIARAK